MTRGVPITAVAVESGRDLGIEDDPQLRILGPHGRVLEGVLKRVHDEAGFGALARERIGLYVATGMVDSAPEELLPAVEASRGANGVLDMERFFAGGYRAIHPLWPLSMLGNIAVGQIATDLDIRGDNLVLAPDAVAGVRAFIEAYHAVKDGLVDGALVAGVNEPDVPAASTRRGGTLQVWHGAAAVALSGPGGPKAWLAGAATAFGRRSEARAQQVAMAMAGVDWEIEELGAAVWITEVLGKPALAVLDREDIDGPATAARFLTGEAKADGVVTVTSAAGGAGALIVRSA